MGKATLLDKNNLPEELEILSKRMKDIRGLTFGRLTAIYPSKLRDNDQSILWVCKCVCGNYVLRSSPNLKRKANHHCGDKIHYIEDQKENQERLRTELNGKINNNLMVIDFSHIVGKKIYLKCKCLKCNQEVLIRKDSFLNGHATSCGCIRSKGEEKIASLLNKNGIKFKKEYKFENLKDKDFLRFDFAIFLNDKLSCLIEYQGIQHFIANGQGWNTKEYLSLLQQHDKLKKDFCENKNITLYYITYKDDIERKIKEIINELYSK